jgi:hypothetical protein
VKRFFLALALAGCFPVGPALEGEADPNECDQSFDDHTHVGAIDVATFERLLEVPRDTVPQSVDFLVVYVSDSERRHVRFEDGAFYEFHDEWYWFRLMNGVTACGSSATPVRERRFTTVQEIEEALKDRPALPLDLARTSGGRLYSPSFYTLSLRTRPRVYATGTLFRWVGSPDRYAFELPLVDAVTSEELHAIHATLEAALPNQEPLFWRAVSPQQGDLAAKIEGDGSDVLHSKTLKLGEAPP